MVIERNRLYDVISTICKGKYAIGMHGIDYGRLKVFSNLSKEEAIEDVLENGLNVYNSRTIHGTVELFGRIDTEEDERKVRDRLEKYDYRSNDYYIVAVPCSIENENYEEILLGNPNKKSKYSNKMGSTGEETTTILDRIILSKEEIETRKLDSEFILGKCKVLKDGRVDFTINPKHMAVIGKKSNDRLLKEFKANVFLFKMLGYKVEEDYFIPEKVQSHEEEIREVMHKIEKRLSELSEYTDAKEIASLWESLNQVLNEKNLHQKTNKQEVEYHEEEGYDGSGIIAEFKKGKYFHVDDTIYVEFKYTDELQESYMERFFYKEFMDKYGLDSERCKQGKEIIMPYLVDIFGNLTANRYNSRIGGTNIPDDLLEQFAKTLIEKGCTIKIGNEEMKEYFDSERFKDMLRNIPNENNEQKQR